MGHGHVHAGEAFPEMPTPALLTIGHVKEGTGPAPADPLAGVYDDDEAAAIRAELEGGPAEGAKRKGKKSRKTGATDAELEGGPAEGDPESE